MRIHKNPQIDAAASAQVLGAAPADQEQRSAKPSHAATGSRGCGDRADQVQLSDLAQRLAAGNANRIAQLQSAIGAGTYTISPSNVAMSMISQSISVGPWEN